VATSYTNPAAGFKAWALQARTDSAGAAVDDADGEDARLALAPFTQGIVGATALAFQVLQRGAGANMSVDVGSGTAESDTAILVGDDPGQGTYAVRLQDATTNVLVNAAHATLSRIDEIYLVVQDHQYDASARVLGRLAYRDGTAAASPVAPGPDAAWDAFMKLASVTIPPADTAITNSQIIDFRDAAGVMLGGSLRLSGGLSTALGLDTEIHAPTSGEINFLINNVVEATVAAGGLDLLGNPLSNVGAIEGHEIVKDGPGSWTENTAAMTTRQSATSSTLDAGTYRVTMWWSATAQLAVAGNARLRMQFRVAGADENPIWGKNLPVTTADNMSAVNSISVTIGAPATIGVNVRTLRDDGSGGTATNVDVSAAMLIVEFRRTA